MSNRTYRCTLRGVPPGRALHYLMTRHSPSAAPRDVYLCPYHAARVAEELRAMVTGATGLADEVEWLTGQIQGMLQAAADAGAEGVQGLVIETTADAANADHGDGEAGHR